MLYLFTKKSRLQKLAPNITNIQQLSSWSMSPKKMSKHVEFFHNLCDKGYWNFKNCGNVFNAQFKKHSEDLK